MAQHAADAARTLVTGGVAGIRHKKRPAPESAGPLFVEPVSSV